MMNRRTIQDYWEYENRDKLLEAMIGQDYGPDPQFRDLDIQKDKETLAQIILKELRVSSEMVGVEIGSGCGYMTRIAAQKTKWIHAMDISHSFLNQAKAHCTNQKNINYHIIESCSLQPLLDNSIDYIYSNNVFIHLNIYEIANYIQEAKRVLKPGGFFWFDFAEIDRCNVLQEPQFLNTMNVRKLDPHNRGCLEFVSGVAVKNLLKSHGLKIKKWFEDNGCDTKVTSTKK